MRKEPKQSRSRMLVDAVMQAAEDLLDARESVSIDQLARKAGVGVASIYEYFGRKDGVVDAVLDRLMESNFERLEQKLRTLDDASLHHTVDSMAGAVASLYFDRPAFLGKVVELIVARGEQRKHIAFRDRFADLLAGRVCRDLRNVRLSEARAAMRGSCDAVMGIITAELIRGETDVPGAKARISRIGHTEVDVLIALDQSRAGGA
jgi:AcrR family transcriptional regulator